MPSKAVFLASLAVLLVCAMAAPSVAQEGEGKPRLIVLDLKANGVGEDIAKSLTDLVAMELERLDKYDIVTRDTLAAILTLEEQKQLLGVEEGDDQIGKVGQALNAPYLLKGSLGQVGSTYLINLEIINTETLRVERRSNQNLVGKSDELIGSLRSAVIAIALEDKGVQPDITQQLLRGLHISEKPKTAFFHFRTGYEINVGPTKDEDDILYFRPDYLHFIVDAEYHVLPWMGIMFSSGFATTLGSKYASQNKKKINTYTGDENGNPVPTLSVIEVRTTEAKFQAMKIPMDFAVKFRPPKGRFLPYFYAGLGYSYHEYSFDDMNSQWLTRTADQFDSNDNPTNYAACAGPYENGINAGNCVLKLNLKPEEDKSFFALDFLTGAGFDYLLTEHIGLSVEARYTLQHSFDSGRDSSGQSDLDVNYTNNSNPLFYNDDANANLYGDSIPIPETFHGIMVTIGLLAYF